MPDLRCAIVGCGAIAAAYRQALAAIPDVTLLAVVDPDPDRRGHLAGDDAIRQSAHIDDLVEVDVALVLTPPNTHEPSHSP